LPFWQAISPRRTVVETMLLSEPADAGVTKFQLNAGIEVINRLGMAGFR
jgi:hypothetical protein